MGWGCAQLGLCYLHVLSWQIHVLRFQINITRLWPILHDCKGSVLTKVCDHWKRFNGATWDNMMVDYIANHTLLLVPAGESCVSSVTVCLFLMSLFSFTFEACALVILGWSTGNKNRSSSMTIIILLINYIKEWTCTDHRKMNVRSMCGISCSCGSTTIQNKMYMYIKPLNDVLYHNSECSGSKTSQYYKWQ